MMLLFDHAYTDPLTLPKQQPPDRAGRVLHRAAEVQLDLALGELVGESPVERRDAHLEALPAWQETCGATSDTETIAARQALQAVADLPPRQRRCLTLNVSGHSHHEIATATNTSPTSVAKQLTRARATVRTASRPGQ